MESDMMYDSPRYMELMNYEDFNERKFIEMHKKYFQVHSGNRQENKVRSVCRTDEATQSTGIVTPVDIERKAEYRRVNNQNSQLSRYKQKVARIEHGLAAVYLRDRVSSYERRLGQMLDIIMDSENDV